MLMRIELQLWQATVISMKQEKEAAQINLDEACQRLEIGKVTHPIWTVSLLKTCKTSLGSLLSLTIHSLAQNLPFTYPRS